MIRKHSGIMEDEQATLSSIFTQEDLVFELCRHLPFEDLYNYGLVNKITRRQSRSYFTHEHGMREQVLAFVRSLTVREVFEPLLEFQQETKAILTGSSLLKYFMMGTKKGWVPFREAKPGKRDYGHYYFNRQLIVRDLDVMVPLNEKSVAAFKKFLSNIADRTSSYSGHDSLSAESFHTGTSPARAPETEDEQVTEVDERFSFEDARREIVKLIVEDNDGYDYTKHVRSVYFKIALKCAETAVSHYYSEDVSFLKDSLDQLDFVFVPECDIAKYASMCDWMQYNFDLQVCANAITHNSLFCLAPHEIISRVAFMRLDQYCLDIEPDEEYAEDYYECVSNGELASKLNAELFARKQEREERDRIRAEAETKKKRSRRHTRKYLPSPDEMKKFLVVHPESQVSREDSNRWNNVKRCECYCIIYNRMQKYMSRGFHFIYGTQAEYQFFEKLDWEKVIVNSSEEEKSERDSDY